MADVTNPRVRSAVSTVVPVLRQYANEVDASARFPVENLKALRETGLLGLLVPVAQGGLGADLADLVEVSQVLAAECLSTAMIWAMHCQQVDLVVRHAQPRLQKHLLPRIARGEVYLASVTTEPGKGGHLLTGDAPVQADGEWLRLDRQAPVVTGGTHSDGFLVTMRASPEAQPNELTLVYADREQLDPQVQGGWDALGMRGTASIRMRLTGSVPAWQIVGEPGGFRTVAIESLAPVGHIAWAACWLGAARGAFAALINLVRSPDRPGSIDVRSDLVTERLARIRVDLELVSGYLHSVRNEVLTHRRNGRTLDTPATQIHLNTLKVVAAERCFSAIDRLVQLAGLSLGYRRDSTIPLERCFRDLRSASLNYANDRLLTASGALAVLDRGVQLAGLPRLGSPD